MPERKISKKSLENLTISNRESNRLTRESLEISLLQLLEKKELAKISYSLSHIKWTCKYPIIFTTQVSQKNHSLQNKTRSH